MKKAIALVLVALLALTSVFASGASEQDANVIKVGATPDPHAAILSQIVDQLAAEGYTLEIVEFTDYVTPNEALAAGELDANYFQHLPYLESACVERGYDLVSAGGIHIEPLAVYSQKYTSLDQIPDGATFGIPNDPTNEGRALLLLESAGLLTLADDAGLEAVPADIVDNPHNFKFAEIEAAGQLGERLAYQMKNRFMSLTSPEAQQLFDELNRLPFHDEKIVLTKTGSQLIFSMSTVSQVAVAHNLFSLFSDKNPNYLQQNISGDIRRNIVWALEEACVVEDVFEE